MSGVMEFFHWIAVAISLLAGFGAGALVVSVLRTARESRLQAERSAAEARAEALEQQLGKAEERAAAALAAEAGTLARLAAAETQTGHLQERLTGEAARIAAMQEQMRLEFESLANRLLEEKSARFLDQNQQNLASLLGPLRERIGEFRERLEVIHTEDQKSTNELRGQLKVLHDLNRKMADEAGNLTSALRGQSKSQGSWGELVLERILEKSGLTNGVEYRTQASFKDEDGGRRMPDVIIDLPEGRNLIIDSKVSLTAYERAVSAGEPPVRAGAMREHAASVRRHVEELAKKDYSSLAGLQAPDFVLMFVPVEPALHAALEEDPSLYNDAFARNVVLVSSSTLLVALRAVESVWRRHKQTLNAHEIAQRAGKLHDAFVAFANSMEEVGSRLDQAKAAHDQALARLCTGRGNLLRRTQELERLGARAEKAMPQTLLRIAAADVEEEQT